MKQVLILLLLFTINLALGQHSGGEEFQMKIDLVYLASDFLEGRESGKDGEARAAEYIVKRFEAIGLQPKGENGDWFQPFSFTYKPNPHAEKGMEVNGKNVVGYIDNGAATTVVIGAHYDHLGRGAFGSRFLDGPAIHNGADDNASGVTSLLYLAKALKNSSLKQNNYLFIAFSGEEFGLFGSKYYVDQPTIDLSTVNYMLNMDMVGRLKEDKRLIVNGAGTSPIWKEELKAISIGGIDVHTTDSGIGPSDHTSFYKKDLPVLHFFTGQHQQYHRPEDDALLINWVGLKDVSDFIFELVNKLDTKGKLAFSKTKDEGDDRKVAKFKVTLGVMPDYAATEDGGMRVDVVLDDRPADRAGIKDGDIIIKIGEKDIDDIYGYMEALSNFKEGDKTIVVVKRGKDVIEKEVEFKE